jgi:hypothetical protein
MIKTIKTRIKSFTVRIILDLADLIDEILWKVFGVEDYCFYHSWLIMQINAWDLRDMGYSVTVVKSPSGKGYVLSVQDLPEKKRI